MFWKILSHNVSRNLASFVGLHSVCGVLFGNPERDEGNQVPQLKNQACLHAGYFIRFDDFYY